jgi:hypothetical protein
MGVFDFLFGGKKESTKPVDVTPPELASLRSPFANTLKTLFGTTGSEASLAGVPSYSGPLTAPITPGEETALSTLTTEDPLQAQRRSLLTDTLAGKFLPGAEGSNPFLSAAIEAAQRPTLEGLVQTLSRTLPGRFTQAGQFVQPQGSSAFDYAAAQASTGAANALKDIATNISFGGYEAERGRQQGAIPLAQQEVQTMLENLQAQALPRLIQENGIERGLSLFKDRLTAFLQALQLATQAPLQTVASKSKGSTTVGAIPTLFPKGFQP